MTPADQDPFADDGLPFPSGDDPSPTEADAIAQAKGSITDARPRTLREIGAEMDALDQVLFDLGGDVSNPDVEAHLDDWFSTLKGRLEEKVDNYAAYVSELDERVANRKAEAQRITDLASRDARTSEALKDRLKHFLKDRDIKKLHTARYDVGWAKNGGMLPLEVDDAYVADPERLPERFQKRKVTPDNTAIREAIKSGEDLEFARFGERGDRLTIR